MSGKNDDLRDLLKRVNEMMAAGLDVPVQELVIYANGKSEGVNVEFTDAAAMIGDVSLYEIKARATWPTGRTEDGSGVVSTEGLSGAELDDAILRCARLAYCRALDWGYPFEDEDLIPPGSTLLSMNLTTGELYQEERSDFPAKKRTRRQIRSGE